MDKDILVVTHSEEPNVRLVSQFLPIERVFRLDYDLFLEETLLSFTTGQEQVGWKIQSRGETVSMESVNAVWFRRPEGIRSPDTIPEQYREFAEHEARRSLRSLWSVSPGNIFWMNHPEIEYSLGFNKPLQCSIAADVGLSIPETLITNSPEEAKKFWLWQGGEVIIKPFGGAPVKDAEDNRLAIYTNRVTRDMLEKFVSAVRHTPVMFQNYIPKDVELRITIVGEEVFSCVIHSQDSERTRDDWRRYDFDNVAHEEYTLPRKVKEQLLAFMRKTQLTFGAVDMIVTPDGEYVFIEVNPSGQWQWIEAMTGMPISETIAETLINPPAL